MNNNKSLLSGAVALIFFGIFIWSHLEHPRYTEHRYTRETTHQQPAQARHPEHHDTGGGAYRVENTEDQRPPALDVNGGHPEHRNLQHLVKSGGGYTINYDNELKGPAAVSYELKWQDRTNDKMKRPSIPFATDEETTAKVTTHDFNGCGYDRGHMCPSFAMGAFHGREAQEGTFVCSNILPQTHLNNAGVWNSIERMEADDFAKRFGDVQITDGPVYNLNPTKTRSGIPIPAAFYKIICRPDNQVICFLVPQITESPKPESYLTSLATIRNLTGLNLLPDVSDSVARLTRTKIW